MVDRELVLRKLAELETYLGQLSEYKNLTVDEWGWRNGQGLDSLTGRAF